MCNQIHLISKPIKKEGKGWKIFSRDGDSCFGFDTYVKEEDGTVVWEEELMIGGKGFCFFLQRREAEKLLRELKRSTITAITEFEKNYYRYHHIRQIRYAEGLVRQTEDNIAGRGEYKCALCRRFQIID